ncbi:MAG: DUF2855 family protein [Alphaproteobacteria bacterium]|nr:DUF2855 family protein [Alphaproteobacteria bacterium]
MAPSSTQTGVVARPARRHKARMALDILTNKSDLRDLRAAEVALPPLQEGEARLRIDRFALTANNITYSAIGERFLYWKFFPTADAGFGRSPVWGFADVEDSRAHDAPAGARLWGYFPLATHLVVTPVRGGETGFFDGAAHRAELPPIYNRYERVPAAPAHEEALTALFRPLFGTSFLIDDHLADSNFFGAEMAVFASASSKTALGAAWLARKRHRAEIVGLTSAQNRTFAERSGAYDRVFAYEEVESLPRKPALLVDMAGNARVLHGVHAHLGPALRHSITVGLTHWDSPPVAAPPPGVAPTMFFAPDIGAARARAWGADVFQDRLRAAQSEFLAACDWLVVDEARGVAPTVAAWRALLDGAVAPERGLIRAL